MKKQIEEQESGEEGFEEGSDVIEDFEETDQEEDLEEDLFEEEEKPAPRTKKKVKPRKRTRAEKPAVETQSAKKPFTKYLLIGIAGLCIVGGGLWIIMPELMPGNQTQYPANQGFQTTSPALTQQPQAQQAQQPEPSNNLFVEPEPKPAVQEPVVNQSQPVTQNQNTLADMNQSMVDPVPAPKENIEDQRFDDIHEMMVQQGEKLEKLEDIYNVIQSLENRPQPQDDQDEYLEKIDTMAKENAELQQAIADLKARNKDLTGKNNHLRYLQNEQAKEIKSLNSKLSEPRHTDFASNWQLTGLSSQWAVILNAKTNEYLRVHVGEVINTTAGELVYNAG
ncbi:MAG: DUF3450 domain-containing protein [Desulfobacteraceae bacterium]|nr:DUF3450 domain-containing protein [Desulfobacteraceae bacterium]